MKILTPQQDIMLATMRHLIGRKDIPVLASALARCLCGLMIAAVGKASAPVAISGLVNGHLAQMATWEPPKGWNI